MIELALLAIGMVLVNDVVLAKSASRTPFPDAPPALETAYAVAACVIIVLVPATILSHSVRVWFPTASDASYVPSLISVLAIATFALLVRALSRRYAALRCRLPDLVIALAAMHGLVLGLALEHLSTPPGLIPAMLRALGVALGFALVLVLSTAMRDRLEAADVPRRVQGMPIMLVNAALIALACAGFAGIVTG